MRIEATFTGANGSLGYRTGERYTLRVLEGGRSVCRTDGTGYCPYQSLDAFLNNWNDVLRVVVGKHGERKMEKVPSSEFSPEFLGLAERPVGRPSFIGTIRDNPTTWQDESNRLFTKGKQEAAYMEILMLRSIVEQVLHVEATDEVLQKHVHRFLEPDGKVEYCLQEPGSLRYSRDHLLLRVTPVPDRPLDLYKEPSNVFVFAEFRSPYFVQKTP